MDSGALLMPRVKIVCEAPYVRAPLMQDWGGDNLPGERVTAQKIVVIEDKPLLAILDASDNGMPSLKPDPPAALNGSDAILLIYREDIPQTFDYIKEFVKAVHSHGPFKAAFNSMQVAVLGLQGPTESESDGAGRNWARSIDATNFYRLSGVGTKIGLDAVLESFLAPIFNYPGGGPPPGAVPLSQAPPNDVVITRGGPMEFERPSRLSRMFSKFKGR